eukprot:399144-Alexandrium_andersonii.AAC.1
MKELTWPVKMHVPKCICDAGTLHPHKPDEAAGPLFEVVGLATEGRRVDIAQVLGSQRLVLLGVEKSGTKCLCSG